MTNTATPCGRSFAWHASSGPPESWTHDAHRHLEADPARASRYFLDFSEWQASQLPDGASVWTSVPFVASDDNPAVQDFVARARRHSGSNLVTHVAFTHYNAVHALKLGMEKAGTGAGDKVAAALKEAELETATGRIRFRGGYAIVPMYVARAVPGRLEVARKFDAVPTGAACT